MKNISSDSLNDISKDGRNAEDDEGEDKGKTIIFDTDQTRQYFPDEHYGWDDSDESTDNEDTPKRKRADKKSKKRGKPKKERPKIKASPKFILLFILTLPISIPILAAFTGIVVLFYAVVIGIIAAFIGCLLAGALAGAVSAMSGIINGAIKLFTSTPIGIYEIGIGLIIGGITILICYAVYLFIVKLLPKLFPLITRFAAFVYGKVADLYYYFKGRCAD